MRKCRYFRAWREVEIIMEATKKNNVACIEDCNLCSSEEVSKKSSIYDLVLKLLNNECARVWWKNAVELYWKKKKIKQRNSRCRNQMLDLWL